MTATLHRTSPLAIRASGDGRTLRGWAVRYGVVDTYGTAFAPGVFDASLRNVLPVLVWGHDWARPLGRVTEYTPGNAGGLPITARFDDPADVPDVRQAIAQVRSGTVTGLADVPPSPSEWRPASPGTGRLTVVVPVRGSCSAASQAMTFTIP